MKGILHVCVCFSLSGYRYLPVSFLLHVKYSLSYRIVSQRRWHRSAWNFARWYISVLDRKSPLLGSVPPGIPNFGHLNANISKTPSRSVTCQLELEKCKTWGGSSLVVPPIWPNVAFFSPSSTLKLATKQTTSTLYILASNRIIDELSILITGNYHLCVMPAYHNYIWPA